MQRGGASSPTAGIWTCKGPSWPTSSARPTSICSPPKLLSNITRTTSAGARLGRRAARPGRAPPADGRRQWIERIKGPVRNADGDIVGVYVLFWDVTDKVEAEAGARPRARPAEFAHGQHPRRDLLQGPGRAASSASAARSRNSSAWPARSEAIGKTDADIFTEEHAQKALRDERRIMETGEPLVAQVEKETWADRDDTWVSTTKMPLRDKKGEIVGHLRHLARRHRAQADAGRADQGPRRGRGGQPGQERVPGQHEPRDSHADERHHRHDGAAARHAT